MKILKKIFNFIMFIITIILIGVFLFYDGSKYFYKGGAFILGGGCVIGLVYSLIDFYDKIFKSNKEDSKEAYIQLNCELCNKKLGKIYKIEINDADIMVKCLNGCNGRIKE